MGFHFILLLSRQGKVRLGKWYSAFSQKDRTKIRKEVFSLISARSSKQCNFMDYRDMKLIYRRYASLYFVAAIDTKDNELIALDTIHHFVETLDKYFGNVCELDLIFNFHRAYYVLDEIIIGGELQESSKRTVLRTIETHDDLVEQAKLGLLKEENQDPRATV